MKRPIEIESFRSLSMHPVLNLPPLSRLTPPLKPLLPKGRMSRAESIFGSVSLEHASYRAVTQATLAKLEVHNPFELWSIHEWAEIQSFYLLHNTMENVAKMLVDPVRDSSLSLWPITDLVPISTGFYRL